MDEIDTTTDTVFFLDKRQFTSEDVMAGIDEVLLEIKKTGEFEVGANTLRSMSAFARVTGWASAKLCHGMKQEWVNQGYDPDNFLDYIKDATHLKPLIVERYIAAWDAVQKIPNHTAELIAQPIKNGIALGAAYAQGYEPTSKQINQLTKAKSNQEFLSVIRDVKGKPPRKSSLTIYLEADGTLQAWQGNKTIFVGDLDVKSDDPMVEKAIKRIVDSAGIIRRG